MTTPQNPSADEVHAAYSAGVKAAIEEVKSLCRDFSSRNGSVYILDVAGALDGLEALLVAEPHIPSTPSATDAATASAAPVGFTLSSVYDGVRRVGEFRSWMAYFDSIEDTRKSAVGHLKFLQGHRPQFEAQLVELYAVPADETGDLARAKLREAAGLMATKVTTSQAPDVPPVIDEARTEAVRDAVASALGDALDCTRVWSAWRVGTMGEDDFRRVADDTERVAEIADAAITAVLANHPSPA